MKRPARHGAVPPAIGRMPETLARAALLCGKTGCGLVRTYDPATVTCASCNRRMRKFPQLVAAMQAARQPSLF